MSDVRLDGDSVFVDGIWTRLRTTDLMLDAPGRRQVQGGDRRALVHDFADGLTVNWANDYPGGVTVNSLRTVSGRNGWIDVDSRVMNVKGTDLMLDSASRRTNSTAFRRALVHDFNDGLTVNWNSDYPGGVTINGPVTIPGTLTVNGTDVANMLLSLATRINQLEARITALEGA